MSEVIVIVCGEYEVCVVFECVIICVGVCVEGLDCVVVVDMVMWFVELVWWSIMECVDVGIVVDWISK